MKGRHVTGEELRACRLRARMTQVELARRAGVRHEAICRLEADAVSCSDLLALKLADALQVEVEAFTRPGRHPNYPNFRSSRRNAAA